MPLPLSLLLVLLFLPLLMSPQATAQTPSLSPISTNADYPSAAKVMIIVVGVVVVITAFISFYFGHFARACFGSTNQPPNTTTMLSSAARGLNASAIETFPTFLYSDVKRHRTGEAALECAVCLSEFEDPETLRLLPICSHVFHPDCIDPWLSSRVTCPVCRTNLERCKTFELRDKPFYSPQNSQNQQEPFDQARQDPDTDGYDFIINVAQSPEIRQATPIRDATREAAVEEGSSVKKFLRSHSTGILMLEEEDFERFTLRLPAAVQSKLVNISFNGTVSGDVAAAAALSAVTSPRSGFRAKSPASTDEGKNYGRFQSGNKPDGWGFSKTLPFISRSGIARSPVSDGEGDYYSKNKFEPVEKMQCDSEMWPPLDDVGERACDRLWPDRAV